MSRQKDNHIPPYSIDLIKEKLPSMFPVRESKELLRMSDRELGFYLGERSVVERLKQLMEDDHQEN